jgi:WS/DGAT/MGAT family acyltransferase
MQQLTGLDALFLHLETDEMPMHVGALAVYELPRGRRGRFVTDVRALVKERLPMMPALRRRLWTMPLNLANPAWVDAVPDLRQHIVEVKLPASARKGDGFAELEALVATLHAQRLDRDRPLWKFHVIEGLGPSADGHRRVALYSQLHHAAVDGQAAVALANVLLDVSPEGRDLTLRPSRRTKVFSHDMTEMLRGAIAGEAMQVARIVRDLPSTLGSLKDAAVQVLANAGLLAGRADKRVSNLALAPRTPLNVSITSGRAFAGVSLPLPELKTLAKAHGITLNDVVLMLCSTALRRYLARHKALPRKSLIAAVPVTLREAGNESPDNQATMSLVSLGTQLADPAKRLAYIVGAAGSMKSTMGSLKHVMPVDYPSIGVPWLMEAATSLYGRMKVADKLPAIANVIISNVPGPAVPLYLAGARLVANRPTSIVVHGCALNITVQSYDRLMEFGLMADKQAMPDVRLLADSIEIALDELRALPLPEVVRRRSAHAALGSAVVDSMGRAARGLADAAVRQAVAGTVGTVAKVAGQRGAVASIKRLARR